LNEGRLKLLNIRRVLQILAAISDGTVCWLRKIVAVLLWPLRNSHTNAGHSLGDHGDKDVGFGFGHENLFRAYTGHASKRGFP
jgi:hypothetical protein